MKEKSSEDEIKHEISKILNYHGFPLKNVTSTTKYKYNDIVLTKPITKREITNAALMLMDSSSDMENFFTGEKIMDGNGTVQFRIHKEDNKTYRIYYNVFPNKDTIVYNVDMI